MDQQFACTLQVRAEEDRDAIARLTGQLQAAQLELQVTHNLSRSHQGVVHSLMCLQIQNRCHEHWSFLYINNCTCDSNVKVPQNLSDDALLVP